jgi:hypothetical protein
MENISGTLFILTLHMYIWMKWAKTDFFRSQKNVRLWFSTRTLDLIFTIILTIWSVKVVNYWKPDLIIIRMIIDSTAVGIIIWYRLYSLPKKYS